MVSFYNLSRWILQLWQGVLSIYTHMWIHITKSSRFYWICFVCIAEELFITLIKRGNGEEDGLGLHDRPFNQPSSLAQSTEVFLASNCTSSGPSGPILTPFRCVLNQAQLIKIKKEQINKILNCFFSFQFFISFSKRLAKLNNKTIT